LQTNILTTNSSDSKLESNSFQKIGFSNTLQLKHLDTKETNNSHELLAQLLVVYCNGCGGSLEVQLIGLWYNELSTVFPAEGKCLGLCSVQRSWILDKRFSYHIRKFCPKYNKNCAVTEEGPDSRLPELEHVSHSQKTCTFVLPIGVALSLWGF
jgi:hypothetical protein